VTIEDTPNANPLLIFSRCVATGMTIEDDLEDISGVGTETRKKIMTVFEEHGTSDEVVENLETALDYYESGEYEYAGKFLRRAVDGL
jgi:hypothetical protein